MGQNYNEEFAEAAGLLPTDMPSSHHPLLENDDEVTALSDIVDVRENISQDSVRVGELTRGGNRQIDVEEALTFPHKHQPTMEERVPTLHGLGSDARDQSAPTDADDASYMTRQDFEDSMGETDPDPNAGMDDQESFGGLSDSHRGTDLSGTVTGLDRGTATHLPQDIGAQGFQIEEPEAAHDPGLEARDSSSPLDEGDNDGDVLPTRPVNPGSREESLDATRQLR
ncbi:MAG: hypothetical protein H7Z41_19110 [Cytophagales bacterium]|nr:hypothetical protein [Armatimonadota bacterium]